MLDQEEFDDLAVNTYRSSDVAAAKVALAELIELARDGRLPGPTVRRARHAREHFAR